MKLGQRIHVVFEGDLVNTGFTGWIHVQDDNGQVHELHGGEVWKMVDPPNWPPQPGDLWQHLGVSFLVEERKGTVWMLADDGEGSVSPEEVLRTRPGIRLVRRGEAEV